MNLFRGLMRVAAIVGPRLEAIAPHAFADATFDADAGEAIAPHAFADEAFDADAGEAGRGLARDGGEDARSPSRIAELLDLFRVGNAAASDSAPLPGEPCDAHNSGDRLSCCTSVHLCGDGEGDCDDDDQCYPGLRCGKNNCRANHPQKWGADTPEDYDCCYDPVDLPCDATNLGDRSSCCTSVYQCGEGQGDCDNDEQCSPGFRCGVNNCGAGSPEDYDCCTAAENYPCNDTNQHSTGRCCTSLNPCGHGEGDCDEDDQCGDKMKCGSNNCVSDFGWDQKSTSSKHDCCHLAYTIVNNNRCSDLSGHLYNYIGTRLGECGFDGFYKDGTINESSVEACAKYCSSPDPPAIGLIPSSTMPQQRGFQVEIDVPTLECKCLFDRFDAEDVVPDPDGFCGHVWELDYSGEGPMRRGGSTNKYVECYEWDI